VDQPSRSTPDVNPAEPASGGDEPWWRSAVFYQIYPRSFADGNGDGIGDLIGLRERLPYLADLGIDALWLSPFYRSPMADGGYDVSDPTDVDPMFGTLADFDELVEAAHGHGIRVTIDIVPNHFSDQHVWFQQALAAGPGSPERARFIFRDGRGEHGELPPNNWPSQFGGPAWKRVPDGQWYMHLFAPEQPDLDWTNPEIPAEFERVLRFWLDRGVDGFRIDVAHGMAKDKGLRDMDTTGWDPDQNTPFTGDLRWDRDQVHEYHRGFRRVLNSYPGDRMAVGEVWVNDVERLARYVRPDELNLTFNFNLVEADWGLPEFYKAIEGSIDAMRDVGAPNSWVLSNHDVERHVTRYGGGAVGRARGRAAALLQLSLPGAVYIYNGDELELPSVDDLPESVLQDPIWERSGHTRRGRDAERVPMPWSGAEPPFGFTSSASTWLPIPASWRTLTAEAELADAGSTLNLYRQALAVRHGSPSLLHGKFDWVDAPDGCLAFRRGGNFIVVINFSDRPAVLPDGEVVLSSAPLEVGTLGSEVPANSTVWLRD
jgi:alpha-glucosidase